MPAYQRKQRGWLRCPKQASQTRNCDCINDGDSSPFQAGHADPQQVTHGDFMLSAQHQPASAGHQQQERNDRHRQPADSVSGRHAHKQQAALDCQPKFLKAMECFKAAHGYEHVLCSFTVKVKTILICGCDLTAEWFLAREHVRVRFPATAPVHLRFMIDDLRQAAHQPCSRVSKTQQAWGSTTAACHFEISNLKFHIGVVADKQCTCPASKPMREHYPPTPLFAAKIEHGR